MENGNLKQKQKEKLKSFEIAMRQIIQDKNNEIEIMKKAILNLNDKCNVLILENSTKTTMNSCDLLQIINEKNNEICILRKELMDTNQSFNNRLLQKHAIDGILTNYSMDIQQERERYLIEMKRLNDMVENLTKENRALKHESESLVMSHKQRVDEINVFTKLHNEDLRRNENLLMEYNNKDSKMEEYERKLAEMQRFIREYEGKQLSDKQLIQELKGEIEKKQRKINEYEKEIESLLELEKKNLNENMINKETYDQMIRTLSDTVTSQCDEIYTLMQSNEKFELLLQEKNQELIHFKEEFNKREMEIYEEYELLQKKAILNPKDLEVKFQAERTSYTTEISQIKRSLKDYEGRLAKALEENERIKREMNEKQREINEIKKNNSEKVNKDELEKLKTINESLKKEIIQLKERNLRLNGEKNELEMNLQRIIKDNENSHKELIEAFEIIENIKYNN